MSQSILRKSPSSGNLNNNSPTATQFSSHAGPGLNQGTNSLVYSPTMASPQNLIQQQAQRHGQQGPTNSMNSQNLQSQTQIRQPMLTHSNNSSQSPSPSRSLPGMPVVPQAGQGPALGSMALCGTSVALPRVRHTMDKEQLDTMVAAINDSSTAIHNIHVHATHIQGFAKQAMSYSTGMNSKSGFLLKTLRRLQNTLTQKADSLVDQIGRSGLDLARSFERASQRLELMEINSIITEGKQNCIFVLVPLIVLILEVIVSTAYLGFILATLPGVEGGARGHLVLGSGMMILGFVISLLWFSVERLFRLTKDHRAKSRRRKQQLERMMRRVRQLVDSGVAPADLDLILRDPDARALIEQNGSIRQGFASIAKTSHDPKAGSSFWQAQQNLLTHITSGIISTTHQIGGGLHGTVTNTLGTAATAAAGSGLPSRRASTGSGAVTAGGDGAGQQGSSTQQQTTGTGIGTTAGPFNFRRFSTTVTGSGSGIIGSKFNQNQNQMQQLNQQGSLNPDHELDPDAYNSSQQTQTQTQGQGPMVGRDRKAQDLSKQSSNLSVGSRESSALQQGTGGGPITMSSGPTNLLKHSAKKVSVMLNTAASNLPVPGPFQSQKSSSQQNLDDHDTVDVDTHLQGLGPSSMNKRQPRRGSLGSVLSSQFDEYDDSSDSDNKDQSNESSSNTTGVNESLNSLDKYSRNPNTNFQNQNFRQANITGQVNPQFDTNAFNKTISTSESPESKNTNQNFQWIKQNEPKENEPDTDTGIKKISSRDTFSNISVGFQDADFPSASRDPNQDGPINVSHALSRITEKTSSTTFTMSIESSEKQSQTQDLDLNNNKAQDESQTTVTGPGTDSKDKDKQGSDSDTPTAVKTFKNNIGMTSQSQSFNQSQQSQQSQSQVQSGSASALASGSVSRSGTVDTVDTSQSQSKDPSSSAVPIGIAPKRMTSKDRLSQSLKTVKTITKPIRRGSKNLLAQLPKSIPSGKLGHLKVGHKESLNSFTSNSADSGSLKDSQDWSEIGVNGGESKDSLDAALISQSDPKQQAQPLLTKEEVREMRRVSKELLFQMLQQTDRLDSDEQDGIMSDDVSVFTQKDINMAMRKNLKTKNDNSTVANVANSNGNGGVGGFFSNIGSVFGYNNNVNSTKFNQQQESDINIDVDDHDDEDSSSPNYSEHRGGYSRSPTDASSFGSLSPVNQYSSDRLLTGSGSQASRYKPSARHHHPMSSKYGMVSSVQSKAVRGQQQQANDIFDPNADSNSDELDYHNESHHYNRHQQQAAAMTLSQYQQQSNNMTNLNSQSQYQSGPGSRRSRQVTDPSSQITGDYPISSRHSTYDANGRYVPRNESARKQAALSYAAIYGDISGSRNGGPAPGYGQYNESSDDSSSGKDGYKGTNQSSADARTLAAARYKQQRSVSFGEEKQKSQTSANSENERDHGSPGEQALAQELEDLQRMLQQQGRVMKDQLR